VPDDDRNDVSAERAALDAAIEALYPAFAGHRLRPWTEPCLECCATREEEAALHAVPVRELTKATLQPYAANAMTTWGDERELRYFIPRLLEIVATEDFGWPDPEVLVRALRDASWTAWPERERSSVAAFLTAWWRFTLASPDAVHDVDVVLCAIGRAVPDMAPYLDAWDADDRRVATDHLVALLNDHWEPDRKRLANAFWDCPDREDQVVRWLTSAAVAERIADAATDPQDHRRSTEAGWALARLP
jgi:hypothetical protein